ncbi:MAG: thioredoxin domain-containing protein [Planctomycetota bacterium]|nr:thioredoxin domain-containing protein [Planctomycetota bacterium]
MKTRAKSAAKGAAGAQHEKMSPLAYGLGIAFLAVCVFSSLMLVLEEFEVHLPGCGPESGCERAANSIWGSVPGLGWPTSFIGLAYFAGLFLAWLWARRGVAPGLRWLIRLGALASVAFTIIMFVGDYICPYCLTVHLANIAFLVVVERSARSETGSAPALVTVAVPFVIASLILWPVRSQHEAAIEQQAESERQESQQQMIEALAQNDGDQQAVDPVDPADPEGTAESDEPPFTGRYRLGPEAAPIRIVAISSYQCPDCRRIDAEIERILAERDDVSFSYKHFPLCSDCNKFAAERGINQHPNGCWAARAAEAAGILYGEEGFWKMHRWLFEHRGSFTNREFDRGLAELGFDRAKFIRVMTDETQTLPPVHADIEEAIELGIHYTPMVFINGVELKGWNAPNAVTRTVEELAATNPPPRTAAADHPPPAFEKYISDWWRGPQRPMPADTHERSMGPDDAPARIVMWGEYQEPNTGRLDARLREIIADLPGVRYSFRHYPIDETCNPVASRTLHPLACRASQAAEAAGRLGGPGTYWRMHEWLFANLDDFSDETLREAAIGMDLDPDTLFAEMETPGVAEAIEEDSRAGKRMGLRAIPFLFINERRVPRWNLEGEPVLETMIEKARTEGGNR